MLQGVIKTRIAYLTVHMPSRLRAASVALRLAPSIIVHPKLGFRQKLHLQIRWQELSVIIDLTFQKVKPNKLKYGSLKGCLRYQVKCEWRPLMSIFLSSWNQKLYFQFRKYNCHPQALPIIRRHLGTRSNGQRAC